MPSQSGIFNVQEFTDLGDPLVGGRLYTYAYGTTTQKAAYTDAAGLVPHTYTSDGLGGEYIALNARGELPGALYLDAGSYDLALKTSAGATVWTRRADPVDLRSELASTDASNGANLVGSNDGAGGTLWTTVAGFISRVLSGSGASVVGYLQSGANKVTRTVAAALGDRVSFKHYGAVADGGGANTNNSTFLQNYLNVGGELKVSDGVYYFSAAVSSGFGIFPTIGNLSKRYSIIGASKSNTIFWYAGTGTFMTVQGGYASEGLHSFTSLRDLTLTSVNVFNNSGVLYKEKAYFDISDVHISGFSSGLTLDSCFTGSVKDAYLRYNTFGLVMTGDAFPDAANSIAIHRMTVQLNTSLGIYAPAWGEGNHIDGLTCEANGTMGNNASGGVRIEINHANGMGNGGISNAYFELNKGAHDLYIENKQSKHVTFVLDKCFFNRASNVDHTQVNLVLRSTGGGRLTVVMRGCGFNSTDTYVPSSARPFFDIGAGCTLINGGGNTFSEIVSLPAGNTTRPTMSSEVIPIEFTNAGVVLLGPAGVTVAQPSTGVYEVTNSAGWGVDQDGYTASAVCSDVSDAVLVRHVRKNSNTTFTVRTVGQTGTALSGSITAQVIRVC